MTIEATFEHEDGYKFIQVYSAKKKFLNALSRLKHSTFLHAIDYTTQEVVYPSDLPLYRKKIIS